MKTGGKMIMSLIVLGGAFFIFKKLFYDKNKCNLETTIDYKEGVIVGQGKRCIPMGIFQFKERQPVIKEEYI
jgi:hypothetical protein